MQTYFTATAQQQRVNAELRVPLPADDDVRTKWQPEAENRRLKLKKPGDQEVPAFMHDDQHAQNAEHH